MSEYGFSEDTADDEEDLLEQVGEGEPDDTSGEVGAGGEEPAAR